MLARLVNAQKALHAQYSLKSTCAAHSSSYCYMMACKTFPNLVMHWMLSLAKMSPTAFVLSMSITTYPHFCQTKHLDAWFGKNEPHHSPPFFKTQTRKTQPIWLRLLSLGSSLLLFYMFSTKPCIFRFNV